MRSSVSSTLGLMCKQTLCKRCSSATFQFSSVQSLSRVQLCDPMNRSTPGLPVQCFDHLMRRVDSLEKVTSGFLKGTIFSFLYFIQKASKVFLLIDFTSLFMNSGNFCCFHSLHTLSPRLPHHFPSVFNSASSFPPALSFQIFLRPPDPFVPALPTHYPF